MPGRTAIEIAIIWRLTPIRSSWYFMSRQRFLKTTRKRSASSGPASFKRLFLKWSLSSGLRFLSFNSMIRQVISPRKIAFSRRFSILRPIWGKKFLSRMLWAFCLRYSSTCPWATRLPMCIMASSTVSIPTAFSKEASSSFCSSFFVEMASAISLSDSIPSARIRTTKGISVGTPGIDT